MLNMIISRNNIESPKIEVRGRYTDFLRTFKYSANSDET